MEPARILDLDLIAGVRRSNNPSDFVVVDPRVPVPYANVFF